MRHSSKYEDVEVENVSGNTPIRAQTAGDSRETKNGPGLDASAALS